MRKFKSLLGVVIIGVLAASLVSCDGDGDGNGGTRAAGDTSEPTNEEVAEPEWADINGSWSGTWADSSGPASGTVSLQIAMVGNSFSSALTFTRNGESTLPTVSGTLWGNLVAFDGGQLFFAATATATAMNGTVTGNFFGDLVDGTFEMQKAS